MRFAALTLALMSFSGTTSAQEGRPHRPDARCLSSIMVSSGGSLNVLDATSVEAATAHYQAYWDRTAALGAAEDNAVARVAEALLSVKKLEDDGASLPGSVEVEREHYLSQVEYSPSASADRRDRFPTCQWPDTNPVSVRDRIKAITLD